MNFSGDATTYTSQVNDTLMAIATKYGVPIAGAEAIGKVNGRAEGVFDVLPPGTKLSIPSSFMMDSPDYDPAAITGAQAPGAGIGGLLLAAAAAWGAWKIFGRG